MKLPLVLACLAIAAPSAALAAGGPSRAAFDKCEWRKLSDETLGLQAWVQRCDYGFRKIDFVVRDHAVAMRTSDGGKPEPVIRVFDLLPGETAETGLRRIFVAGTNKKIAKRCVLAPYEVRPKRAGVKRYSFVPDERYRKELAAKAEEGIPDPPCGELGDQPDFVQYFEVHAPSSARKALLVITGQDTPLFDEETLQLLPSPRR